MLITQIIILIILLFLSAFFSGMETALMSLSMIKVNSLVRQKKKGSKTLQKLKQNPHKLIITILIGNNLVNIAAASLATVVATDLFGSSGLGIATGGMTFLVLLFGEITPKTIATNNAEKISLRIADMVLFIYYVLSPFVLVLEQISKVMLKIFGTKKEQELSEEELRTIVTMGKREGILTKEIAEMMHNVLEFKGTKVTEVMIPTASIEMVDGDKKLRSVLNHIIKSSFSKHPVYLDNKDNVVGILHVDDLLKYVKNKRIDTKVKSLIKPIIFVPESKSIDDLLVEFEGKEIPMAIVVDEYGEVEGLVTLEDILEEIVGEIFDKSDKGSEFVRELHQDLFKVNPKITISELNKVLKLGLKEGAEFTTLAGYIEHKLKKIPVKGEKIKLKRSTIIVDKVTDREIVSVKIRKK